MPPMDYLLTVVEGEKAQGNWCCIGERVLGVIKGVGLGTFGLYNYMVICVYVCEIIHNL